MHASGGGSAGEVIVIGVARKITAHIIVIGMFLNVIDAVVVAIEKHLNHPATLPGLPHDELHVLDPDIPDELGIAAAGHGGAAVGHRGIFGSAQPGMSIMRAAPQPQLLEAGSRSTGIKRVPGVDRIVQLRRAIFPAETRTHASFCIVQAGGAATGNAGGAGESGLGSLRVDQFDATLGFCQGQICGAVHH